MIHLEQCIGIGGRVPGFRIVAKRVCIRDFVVSSSKVLTLLHQEISGAAITTIVRKKHNSSVVLVFNQSFIQWPWSGW